MIIGFLMATCLFLITGFNNPIMPNRTGFPSLEAQYASSKNSFNVLKAKEIILESDGNVVSITPYGISIHNDREDSYTSIGNNGLDVNLKSNINKD